MKKFIFTFIFSIFLLNSCQSQSKCACLEDYKHNDGVLGTQPSIEEKKDGKYLTFHCATVMRLYINNEEGNEIEEIKLDCISSEKITLKLTEDFEYFISHEETQLTNKDFQKLFLNKIKSDSNQFYNLILNEKKEITKVQDFWMPEPKIDN